jgi:hypothetical protein
MRNLPTPALVSVTNIIGCTTIRLYIQVYNCVTDICHLNDSSCSCVPHIVVTASETWIWNPSRHNDNCCVENKVNIKSEPYM